MSFATVNGLRVTEATLRWPRRGAWVADVRLDSSTALVGAVVLVIGALSLAGTVVRGGDYAQGGYHRIVAGAASWGTVLAPRSYRNDAGVKRSLVLADAAREAGESLVLPVGDASLGPAWARRWGPARDALAAAWGPAWYVSEAGPTLLGDRPAAPVTVAYRVLERDPRHGAFMLATEEPEGVRPGMVLEGQTIAAVTATLGSTLRLHVWGAP